MFQIANITIDPALLSLRFRCDLKRCKGACCTIPGGRGAPLLDNEIDELGKALPHVRQYLSSDNIRVIDQRGFFEGPPGDYATTCVERKACVFVMMENGIAKCSLEHAFLRGEIPWRKPLSCHLFPIRIDRDGNNHIRFEHLEHCEPAHEHGTSTGTHVSDFLREALVRAYGPEWTQRFIDLCELHRNNGESRGGQP